MLDNCGQGSFVKKYLLEELKVEGKSATVTVKTDLEEANIEGKEVDWITLPRMFSQDDLPVASDEIATPENIQQWKYLHRIIPEMKMDRNLDVKLLIGANCLEASEPQEVISSQGDGPYAFNTKLGWCVVGPISDGSYQNRFHCNRILVEDHAIGKIAKHHFAIPKCVGEDGITGLLKKLYAADFMENQALPSNGINERINEVSAEDIKFLKLMDKGCTRSYGHYQQPLPFRNSEVDLPNNKWLAETRLQSLKKKLQKDEKFHTDYVAFMDNLFNKGYASESTGIQASSS